MRAYISSKQSHQDSNQELVKLKIDFSWSFEWGKGVCVERKIKSALLNRVRDSLLGLDGVQAWLGEVPTTASTTRMN